MDYYVGPARQCDVCHSQINEYDSYFTCHRCNYDECVNCHSLTTSYGGSSRRRFASRAVHAHSLTYVKGYYGDTYYVPPPPPPPPIRIEPTRPPPRRLPQPTTVTSYSQHSCNSCGGLIAVSGYRCSSCSDFDLCEGCFFGRNHSHNRRHTFNRLLVMYAAPPPPTIVYVTQPPMYVQPQPQPVILGTNDIHAPVYRDAYGNIIGNFAGSTVVQQHGTSFGRPGTTATSSGTGYQAGSSSMFAVFNTPTSSSSSSSPLSPPPAASAEAAVGGGGGGGGSVGVVTTPTVSVPATSAEATKAAEAAAASAGPTTTPPTGTILSVTYTSTPTAAATATASPTSFYPDGFPPPPAYSVSPMAGHSMVFPVYPQQQQMAPLIQGPPPPHAGAAYYTHIGNHSNNNSNNNNYCAER